MQHKVLLAGSGRLGSRYLQRLATCTLPLEVFVVDPRKSSLDNAREMWETELLDFHQHNAHFCKTLVGIPDQLELCIVATTADVRLMVIEQVLAQSRVHYWVLEKVLAQSGDQIDRMTNRLFDARGAWVNVVRRSCPWHQEIYKQIPKGKPWRVEAAGGAWGLASNSIHLIDLVSWWSGESLVSIDTSGLGAWFPSKRLGAWEVEGSIEAAFSCGSVLNLKANQTSSNLNLIFQNKFGTWILDEPNGSFVGPSNFSLPGKFSFQSEITGLLIRDILTNGECPLADLYESAEVHKMFIEALLRHWSLTKRCVATLLPIT